MGGGGGNDLINAEVVGGLITTDVLGGGGLITAEVVGGD